MSGCSDSRERTDAFGPDASPSRDADAPPFSGSVFHRVLDKYFQSDPDRKTIALIGVAP